MRDPKMILVIEEERQAAVLENDRLRAEVAEWKERHPYGEVDLDMAIEAATKDLKLRIDTLEGAQIDYEAQCAAKDASIAEVEAKLSTAVWSRDHERADNGTLHKRIAELEGCAIFEMYQREFARAERAEAAAACYARQVGSADAENANLRDAVKRAEASHEQQVIVAANYAERAERAEAEALKAKAHIAELCDAMVYSDSYGVQGSAFQCCHACSAGGSPNVVFKHDEHCPVGKAEASAAEWWDDYKAAEEDRERAEAERDAAKAHVIDLEEIVKGVHFLRKQAEAERDALLYNAESQYCAGMSAGFELGRNDDRAELSRIITQRWGEIADAKARAALAPSPARQDSIPDRTFERDLAELRAFDRMRAERDSLREALELLVRRLDNIWTKSNLASVFLIADRYGIKYTGETWIEPLDKARAALNPSPAGEKSR